MGAANIFRDLRVPWCFRRRRLNPGSSFRRSFRELKRGGWYLEELLLEVLIYHSSSPRIGLDPASWAFKIQGFPVTATVVPFPFQGSDSSPSHGPFVATVRVLVRSSTAPPTRRFPVVLPGGRLFFKLLRQSTTSIGHEEGTAGSRGTLFVRPP